MPIILDPICFAHVEKTELSCRSVSLLKNDINRAAHSSMPNYWPQSIHQWDRYVVRQSTSMSRLSFRSVGQLWKQPSLALIRNATYLEQKLRNPDSCKPEQSWLFQIRARTWSSRLKILVRIWKLLFLTQLLPWEIFWCNGTKEGSFERSSRFFWSMLESLSQCGIWLDVFLGFFQAHAVVKQDFFIEQLRQLMENTSWKY